MIKGKLDYMAPEQARGRPTRRSDVFSLGVLLYNIVAGRPPFQGADPASIFAQTLYKDTPRVSEVVTDVPESLERVIAHALAKNANDRYRSATELVVIPVRRTLQSGNKTFT